MQNNHLHRFILEQANVRGIIVCLEESWQQMLNTHPYPGSILELLGHTLSATLLLRSNLKYEGSLILQARSPGPLELLFAEATSHQSFRGLARWKGDTQNTSLQQLLKDGTLAVTVNKTDEDRYQSIVPIQGESLAQALDNYFNQSEQLNTRLWLAADKRRTVGLLLQQLPESSQTGPSDDDGWNRIQLLSDTITQDELLNLDVAKLIHRLYHEEDLRKFEPEALHFQCQCSKTRISNALYSIGQEELHKSLQQQDTIQVTCEFCNQTYSFDKIDIQALFSSNNQQLEHTQH